MDKRKGFLSISQALRGDKVNHTEIMLLSRLHGFQGHTYYANELLTGLFLESQEHGCPLGPRAGETPDAPKAGTPALLINSLRLQAGNSYF